MYKRVLKVFLIVSLLFILVGCGEQTEIKDEIKTVVESYGLKDVKVDVKKEKQKSSIGGKKWYINRVTINTTGGFSDLSGEEMLDINKEIEGLKQVLNTSHQVSLTSLIENSDVYHMYSFYDKDSSVFLNGNKIFSLKSKNKPSKKASSKDDYYDQHPEDDDWKDVVDGLYELLGDDD